MRGATHSLSLLSRLSPFHIGKPPFHGPVMALRHHVEPLMSLLRGGRMQASSRCLQPLLLHLYRRQLPCGGGAHLDRTRIGAVACSPSTRSMVTTSGPACAAQRRSPGAAASPDQVLHEAERRRQRQRDDRRSGGDSPVDVDGTGSPDGMGENELQAELRRAWRAFVRRVHPDHLEGEPVHRRANADSMAHLNVLMDATDVFGRALANEGADEGAATRPPLPAETELMFWLRLDPSLVGPRSMGALDQQLADRLDVWSPGSVSDGPDAEAPQALPEDMDEPTMTNRGSGRATLQLVVRPPPFLEAAGGKRLMGPALLSARRWMRALLLRLAAGAGVRLSAAALTAAARLMTQLRMLHETRGKASKARVPLTERRFRPSVSVAGRVGAPKPIDVLDQLATRLTPDVLNLHPDPDVCEDPDDQTTATERRRKWLAESWFKERERRLAAMTPVTFAVAGVTETQRTEALALLAFLRTQLHLQPFHWAHLPILWLPATALTESGQPRLTSGSDAHQRQLLPRASATRVSGVHAATEAHGKQHTSGADPAVAGVTPAATPSAEAANVDWALTVESAAHQGLLPLPVPLTLEGFRHAYGTWGSQVRHARRAIRKRSFHLADLIDELQEVSGARVELLNNEVVGMDQAGVEATVHHLVQLARTRRDVCELLLQDTCVRLLPRPEWVHAALHDALAARLVQDPGLLRMAIADMEDAEGEQEEEKGKQRSIPRGTQVDDALAADDGGDGVGDEAGDGYGDGSGAPTSTPPLTSASTTPGVVGDMLSSAVCTVVPPTHALTTGPVAPPTVPVSMGHLTPVERDQVAQIATQLADDGLAEMRELHANTVAWQDGTLVVPTELSEHDLVEQLMRVSLWRSAVAHRLSRRLHDTAHALVCEDAVVADLCSTPEWTSAPDVGLCIRAAAVERLSVVLREGMLTSGSAGRRAKVATLLRRCVLYLDHGGSNVQWMRAPPQAHPASWAGGAPLPLTSLRPVSYAANVATPSLVWGVSPVDTTPPDRAHLRQPLYHIRVPAHNPDFAQLLRFLLVHESGKGVK